ncbi:hypothetical protein UFOVP1604_69 [uncultured Caudovirales phage]|uniref:Uncharacterized protein n=1 Tax=uncultured Caudovirales phage TaxID=2100421 RepID=A0A6J5SVF3_9CAUD|nr:hypothetical protein UFOVP1604_69 [uncultured Caudovirales phage]
MPLLIKLHEDGREEVKEQGARVEAIAWNEDRSYKEVVGSEPVIGCSILVGSVTARSYSDQDYWLTTKVTEILEKQLDSAGHIDFVKFRTEKSVYVLVGDLEEWKKHKNNTSK